MESINTEDIPEKIFKTLKVMILEKKLKPGEKLRQEDLARKFGVSRTPILSAFSKLEKEQLVEFIPRRGAFVRNYSTIELIDIYEIRLRLESLGALKASLNHTEQQLTELKDMVRKYAETDLQDDNLFCDFDFNFHMSIMAMSRSPFLYNLISSFNIISLSNIGNNLIDHNKSLEEHRKIIDALEKRDSHTAESLMTEHIKRTLMMLREQDKHDNTN